ncbi:MRC1-like domain-containing protein [Aspergillus avenaceus]|uniref:MRC1-like domain-containing protein n=1 Tax=Aspergillus avenaceus TaxID=36643 RepID=A0A5N6U0T9_ASPAV|nr:MRC1-like domain-containing protein [Aspergillus avenaceus]
MSAPSTPRTARSASPAADSPAILTPGQKIKAMLAEFDSDSDSDNAMSKRQPLNSRLTDALKKDTVLDRSASTVDLDEDEDDDDIIAPKGRMAARLRGDDGTDKQESAIERVSRSLKSQHIRDSEPRDSPADEAMSSDDDLPVAGPRRKAAATRALEESDDDSNKFPSRPRAFSPLFVSENEEEPDEREDVEDDEPRPKANSRFFALVAQKRKEREEKEKAEAEKKAERAKQREQISSEIGDDSEADDDSGKKLSQPARPARKASRKALEEMNRETQRISRNMQLAHQAQTKKKITKESFFARFNFMQPQQQTATAPAADSSSTTADSQNSSDAEAHKAKETPHTSPVLGPSEKLATGDNTENAPKDTTSTEFPTLEEMVAKAPETQGQPVVNHMQEHAQTAQPHVAEAKKEKKVLTAPPVRVRLSRQQVAQKQKDDSDSDDLEIITSPAKCRRFAAFENLPARRMQESASMIKLKALAQLNSPPRKSTTMTNTELSAHLLLEARRQANKERNDRIEELRAKGIIVETAEERAAMEDELENLVEKARKEAEEIAKQERAGKGENGDDDDDDEDYDFSGSEDEEGSDGDGDEDEQEEDVDMEGPKDSGLIDSEAGEDEASGDEQTEAMSSDEVRPTKRRKRPTRVISDDEDEDPAPQTPAKTIIPNAVHSAERPQIPGLPADDMTMSLTQAFAGTLGENQQSTQEPSTMLHSLPDPVDGRQESDSQMIIKDSQEQRPEAMDAFAGYEARVSESPARAMSEFSQIPDPTQDAGFVLSPFDPSKRFISTPASTIETVVINRDESRNNSPVVGRQQKHLRRGRTTELSVIEEQSQENDGVFEIDASAFDVMKKATKKKPTDLFDKNKSKAKDVVEEAAEESDDEYAGLGGASDDDDDEENAYDRQMINDQSGETVDEKQLAALNALHQRNTDEKQVAKLLKDITTGALRRRRAAGDDYDLDDSDDEYLARRREKQREFARMRKALMADEKIGEIAENPKKAAFFKAVEDRDMDDDGLDFLEDEEQPESQDEPSSQDVVPDSQPHTTSETANKKKRPLEASAEDVYNRPPPNLRRKPASAMSKKPATLAEIRETLSFLTETPEYDSFHEDASVDEEEKHDDEGTPEEPSADAQPSDEFVAPRHPRRTKGPVVDRLALLRQASSNSATSSSSNTRFAFQTGSGADPVGFRPPMIRKGTTASSSASSKSDSSKRVTKPSGIPVAKKGAVNYYTAAREKERERELRVRERSSGSNITALLNKHAGNRLGSLGKNGSWD